MTRAQTIADSVLMSRDLLKRYLGGFDDTTHTRQAADLPNHVAWTLGHLSHTMHRVSEKLDAASIPEADFFTGGGRSDSRRYDTEAVCFGSKPVADATAYPSLTRCIEIFDRAIERLSSAARNADDAALDRKMPWGSMEIPVWAAAARMVFHNGIHTGQIADLRRAMRMKSIFA
jgi:hypothetical protein